MPARGLTAKGIEAIEPPASGQVDYPDDRVPGLSLRVSHTDRRAWTIKYRQHGRQRRYTLGHLPGLGLSEARKEAERFRVRVRQGYDPVAERRLHSEKTSLGALMELYLVEYAEKNLAPSTVKEARRILFGPDLRSLRNRPAVDVMTADVAFALDRIERRKKMTMLNRTQTALSAVYTWASTRRRAGVVSNPVRPLPRRHHEGGGDKRFLDVGELRLLASALNESRGIMPWGRDALLMILATGQRPGEALRARWEHLLLNDGLWVMPRGFRKRVRGQRQSPAHKVPLTGLIMDVLDRRRAGRTTGFVFTSSGASGHKSTTDLNQRITRGLLVRLDADHFTPHDLRRTCRTHLSALGVPRHIAEKILGHVDGSVAGVYDRHDYWPERIEALERWEGQMRELGF